jgi:orotidine-5'-phosphate decarboxylase
MTSQDKLNYRITKGLHVCVGLDSDINKIPKFLLNENDPVYEFNKRIFESTYDVACAYKINLAFYERDGKKGIESLQKTLEIFPDDVLIIGDAKRGDIGNTSQMYAEALFDHLKFDASTLHPYMGFDSVEPFLNYKNKLNFILALTSNPGNSDFEKLKLEDGTYLYKRIITKVHEWNKFSNCGIVFGATNSDELKENINLINNLPVLLPGVGAQGGSFEDIVSVFQSANQNNFIINISRALIFADNSTKFDLECRKKLIAYNNLI